MGVLTNLLKLLKPGENDYYNQQTEQADNWDKVDNYAVLTNTDKNGIWGGEYGGGLIEDPSVTKVVGKRYIGADGKAYICLVPSNVNNSTNYRPCNVVDNLNKTQEILSRKITRVFQNGTTFKLNFAEYEYYIFRGVFGNNPDIELTGDCTVTQGVKEVSALGINKTLAANCGFNITGNPDGSFYDFRGTGTCTGVNVYGVNKLIK